MCANTLLKMRDRRIKILSFWGVYRVRGFNFRNDCQAFQGLHDAQANAEVAAGIRKNAEGRSFAV
jgi:hypothetical protein